MSEQVPPPSSGAPSDPPADPSPSSGSTPGSGSGSSSKGWAMVAIGFCVVVLGVLVAGVVSRDDSGKSANTAPSVSVGVTQATTAVEGHTVTQTAPPATVTGEVTVTGSTPTTTRTTPTTPTTTRTTDSSGTQTSTTSP
jgi:hypothetical protein